MLACRCCARFTITGLGGEEENCLTSVVTTLEFFFFFKVGVGDPVAPSTTSKSSTFF